MGEKRREYTIALKKILKPDKGKIAVFSILIMLMFFIPIYPTNVTEYPGLPSSTNPEDDHRVYSPLILIIIIDFEHEFQDDFQPVHTNMTTHVYMPTSVSVYKANPSFLIFYCILTLIFYILSCYCVEKIRWKKKFVYEKGVREL